MGSIHCQNRVKYNTFKIGIRKRESKNGAAVVTINIMDK